MSGADRENGDLVFPQPVSRLATSAALAKRLSLVLVAIAPVMIGGSVLTPSLSRSSILALPITTSSSISCPRALFMRTTLPFATNEEWSIFALTAEKSVGGV